MCLQILMSVMLVLLSAGPTPTAPTLRAHTPVLARQGLSYCQGRMWPLMGAQVRPLVLQHSYTHFIATGLYAESLNRELPWCCHCSTSGMFSGRSCETEGIWNYLRPKFYMVPGAEREHVNVISVVRCSVTCYKPSSDSGVCPALR